MTKRGRRIQMTISVYEEDLKYLNDKVKELRRRGVTHMNKSLFIRLAVRHANVNVISKGARQWR